MHTFCRGCFFEHGTKMAADALARGGGNLFGVIGLMDSAKVDIFARGYGVLAEVLEDDSEHRV